MATITERQPGVFFARVWLPPTSDGQKGRQVGKVFRGGKDVRAAVSAWEAELRGTGPLVGPCHGRRSSAAVAGGQAVRLAADLGP